MIHEFRKKSLLESELTTPKIQGSVTNFFLSENTPNLY